ncbi:MBG domain-containing protein, partial [Algoriphagus sp. SE2]|uniref:beta strand repeat-containing protein n=1 Tax=Algoriphagus sp. SE2 TaxID=3141536 RepID=UPI0031CD7C93
ANIVPVATAPTAPIVTEDDVDVALADDIQVGDGDGDDQTLTFTITGGTLTIGTTGITFGGSGNGSASFTAAGTVAALNTALDAATFSPTPGLVGTDAGTIAFVANDGLADSNTASVDFDITPKVSPPDVPTLSIPVGDVCEGSSVDILISGNLNDATNWAIYTGSCGGTLIGTTTTGSFNVTPTSPSTTYYVRGEGGAVSSGACGTITISTVPLDDASFSYSSSSYTTNGPDPSPTFATIGGTFSSTPGLSINALTGTIDLSASTPSTYTVTYTTSGACPSSSNQSITILPSLTVSVNDPTVTEGNTGSINLTFTVSLSQAAPVGGATVDFATSNGTATAGSDYTAIGTTTLSFFAGESSKTVDISIISDETVEFDETLTLTLSNPTGTGVIIGDATGIGTITNDDQSAVTIADVTVDENSGTAIITVILDNAVDGGFDVDLSTADGTATTADSDYTPVTAQTLTFAGTAGESETFNITLGGDTKVEIDERVSISMSGLSPVIVDAADINIADDATLTINNDDQATVTIADVGGNEDDGAITVTATLNNAVDGGFDVDVSTADGTANTANSDYTPVTSQTLSFAGTAGETQTLTVTPTADVTSEPNETVLISMSNVVAGTVSSGDIDITDGATVTILNDDSSIPVISQVVVPAPGTYSFSLIFDVVFSEEVDISGGLPALSLNIGGQIRQTEEIFSGTIANSYRFRYNIRPTDLDLDGIEVLDFNLNGGSIKSTNSGTDADLTLNNVGNTSAVLVDGVGPTGYVVSIDLLGESVINVVNQNIIEFSGTGLEVGATLNYSFASDGGGTPVTGAETVTSTSQQFDNGGAGYDLSGLTDGTVTLTVSLTDLVGNTGASVTDNDEKDTSPPIKPGSPDLLASSDSGISDTDNITNDVTPTLEGTAEPNSTVSINSTIDGLLGTSIVNGSGLWTFTPATDLSTGIHSITVTATDLASNTSPSSDPLSLTIDTMAPVLNLINTLSVQLDANGNSLVYNATDFLASSITDDFSITANIQLAIDKNQFDCSNVGVAPTDITVTATDEAGNSDFAVTYAIVLDNISPNIVSKASIILNVEAFGSVTLLPGMVDEGSNDACGILSQTFSKSVFDRTDEGVNNINYIVTDVNGNSNQVSIQVTIVVVPKVLNIVTDPGQSKAYGDTDPVFTYTATGFESGDDEGILTGALTRTAGENVGTYGINQGTLDAGPNYTINFTPANFEITTATLDISANAGQSKVYGDADPIFTYSVNGLKNGDTDAVINGSLIRIAGEDVGSYAFQPGTINAGGNYTINFASADFDITPATITGVTLSSGSFVFDGTAKLLAITGTLPT